MTEERYEVRFLPPARRAVAQRLPESVAAAVIELADAALATDPHRVGKPLFGPLAGCHGARRGTYRVIYRAIEDYAGGASEYRGAGGPLYMELPRDPNPIAAAFIEAGCEVGLPRVESPTHLMVLGQAGSLDEALRMATTGMMQWLQQDYGLGLSEASQLLGACVEYRVATLAGRNVGLVAKVPKALLEPLVPDRKK